MNANYTDILRQIEPYKDKVFYYGLTEDEVVIIEKNIGKRFPNYFREFLKVFGVRQDFVSGLLNKEGDFVEQTAFLPEDIKNSFVIIGDNGGEDFWLLNTENENDTNVYQWQHWLDGKVANIGYNFETLINESISKLSDTKIKRETNDNKFWNVQFAIPTNDEKLIYSTIQIETIQDWELEEISPAKVHCYLKKVKLDSTEIILTKQEYYGWDSPIYYFNLKEPVSNFGKYSLIKDIDNKLKQTFSDYSLVDYGILSLTEELDD